MAIAKPFSSASACATELVFCSPSNWENTFNSHIGHTCQLNIDQVAKFSRATSLACTLGESWCSYDGIKKMIDNGMNILRLNMGGTSRDTCRKAINIVRELDKMSDYKHCTAVAMDLIAECLQTGFFEGGPKATVVFQYGDKVELTMDESVKNKCTKNKIYIDTSTFPQMIHHLHNGDHIYFGDGLICLVVKEIGIDSLVCLVQEGGPIAGYQRVVLPRERLYHRHIQANYMKDLAFAVECRVDFVFTSYADDARMFSYTRSHLPSHIKIFANVETRESVRNLSQLIEHSDGIIISRADLGMRFSPVKVFKLQKYIIGHCNVERKPVFVIAQLLDSMYNKPRPTRAEASDVANAVLDGADGLILNSETAEGIYPHDAVQFMDQICREAERARLDKIVRAELNACRLLRGPRQLTISNFTASSAVEAAENCHAKAIFVITSSGESAKSVASAGPCCPVIAITRHPRVARHCLVYRGLSPFVYTGEILQNWSEDVDLRLNAAIASARADGTVSQNDNVIIVTGSTVGKGNTNTMQIFKVPDETSQLNVVSSKHSLVYPDFNPQDFEESTENGDTECSPQGPDDLDVPGCPL